MRVALMILALVLTPAAAHAQDAAAPASLDAIYACAAEQNDAARLACYDAAAGRLRAAEQRGEVVTINREQVENIERESFGLSMPSLPRILASPVAAPRPQMTESEMVIERVGSAGGRALFVMTNGQSWMQIGSENARRVRPGGKVTVRRAALGSFLMSVEAGGPAIRVRRSE